MIVYIVKKLEEMLVTSSRKSQTTPVRAIIYFTVSFKRIFFFYEMRIFLRDCHKNLSSVLFPNI